MNYIKDITAPDMVRVEQVTGRIAHVICIEIEEIEDGYRWIEIRLPFGVWGRSEVISAIVRLRYSVDDVEAILNNVLNDPFDESRMTEYKALQEWRKKAKVYASELMTWADEHGICTEEQPDEGYEPTNVEVVPDGMTMLMQGLSLLKSQAQELPDERAVEVPALFPTWDSLIGKPVEVGKRLFYAGRLWKVLQAHTIQENWPPDIALSLFTEVVAQQEGEPEIGTLENPIPYNGNMELEEGKYYSQDGVVYRCFRSSGAPVYHPLSQLVGLYVEVV